MGGGEWNCFSFSTFAFSGFHLLCKSDNKFPGYEMQHRKEKSTKVISLVAFWALFPTVHPPLCYASLKIHSSLAPQYIIAKNYFCIHTDLTDFFFPHKAINNTPSIFLNDCKCHLHFHSGWQKCLSVATSPCPPPTPSTSMLVLWQWLQPRHKVIIIHGCCPWTACHYTRSSVFSILIRSLHCTDCNNTGGGGVQPVTGATNTTHHWL